MGCIQDVCKKDEDQGLHLVADRMEDILCKKDDEQGRSQLHLAAECGDTETVRSLLMSSANVDVLDKKHNTPLHSATLNGHVDVVNFLLSKNANVNSANAFGQTSLHLAATIGDFAITQILLKSNADVYVTDQSNNTPIHVAAMQGHAEIVKNLINFNGATAYVNACNNAKMTALHFACKNGYTSIVETLLDNNATVDVMKQSQQTPFYLAAESGHADTVDLLLCRGVYDFVQPGYTIDTPLLDAVTKGHTDVVEVILKHSSRISGKLSKERYRLQENAKNLVETRGVIPGELSKDDGRRVSAGIVWREQTTPLEIRTNFIGYNALRIAASSVKPEMVRLLLSGDQCIYSEQDLFESFRSLIEATGLYGKDLTYLKQHRLNVIEFAQVLINLNKFDANYQDADLSTLLHDVMKYGSFHSNGAKLECPELLESLHNQMIGDLLNLLLQKGADFNMKNSKGETPLMIASEKGRDQAIQILFDWEHKSGIKLDLDARDRWGATALIKAAEGNHVSSVRLLLNQKASVNLYDYCGFTALHAAVHDPNRNWFDLHFFCKWLFKRKADEDEFNINIITTCWMGLNMYPHTLGEHLECNKKVTLFKGEIIKLLLDNDETNVNSIDFKGNTPLDLAVKSFERISSTSFEALKNRGAIRKSKEAEDKAPIEEARVDERGRNPLHRLMLSLINVRAEDKPLTVSEVQDRQRLDLMVRGILFSPQNLRKLATAADFKGRTPLHYVVMSCFHEPVTTLMNQGSNVNAADMYGKTPLHYAEINFQYDLLVQFGANENTKDKHGHTPRELRQLQESVYINSENARIMPIGMKSLYANIDIPQGLNPFHVGLLGSIRVTELSTQKLIETIRIYSQSPRPQESSEEAIWKIWTENEFFRLNRRLRQLKAPIHQFIKRLADGIKQRDWRFECQPILVGSAQEETKAVISADFDYNFKLNKFSQICDPFPHPLGPKGYFQLKRKLNDNAKSRSDEKFDSFFNLDHFLLTNEVNSRFKIILNEVFSDPAFWQDEHHFDWNVTDKYKSTLENLDRLFKTVRLRMIHPIEDGEGSFLFVDISIDIVACINLKDWWPEDPLPVGIRPSVKLNGSTFVFDRPRFDPSKQNGSRIVIYKAFCPNLYDYGTRFLFWETFARVSFAPVESRIIRESSPLTKAAYIVCKIILYSQSVTTYQLKTCLLFCMEALRARNGSETAKEGKISPKHLAFWVERILFCFMEFSRHHAYPCYLMPSFRQRTASDNSSYLILGLPSLPSSEVYETDPEKFTRGFLKYSRVFDIYLDLCPDDTGVDIPVFYEERDLTNGLSPNVNHDPMWEQFDREEFIRKLSSRIVPAT